METGCKWKAFYDGSYAPHLGGGAGSVSDISIIIIINIINNIIIIMN